MTWWELEWKATQIKMKYYLKISNNYFVVLTAFNNLFKNNKIKLFFQSRNCNKKLIFGMQIIYIYIYIYIYICKERSPSNSKEKNTLCNSIYLAKILTPFSGLFFHFFFFLISSAHFLKLKIVNLCMNPKIFLMP